MTDQQRSDIHDYDNMVTVLVGKEEKRFTLHQDAVCAKSKFFKAACHKQWLEWQKRIVRLPEVEAATFQPYCHWIYFDNLPASTCVVASPKSDKHDEHMSLIKLHLLGDTLDDVGLRDKATLRLLASMQSYDMPLSIPNLKLIYESTPSGSLLRKMVVDLVISSVDQAFFKVYVDSSPAEFVREVAVAALGAVSRSALARVDIDQYMEVKKRA